MTVAGGKIYALSISMNATLRILDGKIAETFWAYLSMNLSIFRAVIFCIPKREKHGGEKSAILESNTSAATVEVLAAMCNYGDELACQSFWHELEALSRQALRSRMSEDEWAYDIFANVFLRTESDERSARKSNRYWAGHKYERDEIIDKYGRSPYEDHVILYLKYGTRLESGTRSAYDNTGGAWQLLTMPFDDTADLLGFWRIWLVILTP